MALFSLVFFTGDKKPHPKLGLDLQGGTSMTLKAATLGGQAPDKDRLERARQIIASRVDSTGVSEPEVVTEGNSNIVVNVAGKNDKADLRRLVAPAELRFRKVVAAVPDTAGVEPTPTPSASASGSAAPAPSASGSATPAPSASGNASAAAGASAAPSASATPDVSLEKRRAAVIAKLGPAYQAAQAIQSPEQVTPQQLAALKPFGELSADEVAALPADIQFNVPTITCKQLNGRMPGSISDPKQTVVACGKDVGATEKYKLDVAKVVGEDVKDAGFTNQPTQGWVVNLSFKNQDKWTNLSKEVFGAGAADKSQRQVAIVLDNQVVSAPSIEGVMTGDAQIYGQFSREDVVTLAQQLKYGSLPLSFAIEDFTTVTPTLGTQQMKMGLLAGAIGVALVILYCLFYYRALGLVVILSLLASGVLVFASLVLLGRFQGYTLSLAGIAGFIVAIGITADSFVVYFERLKDEVKDGRTVRSAVPRAWVRARRTILSADTVSFLAAAVLYVLAIGAVKGFAFTLGLSTLIDVLVVFLFTHPLVALLSRSSTFTSPRISGLGNLRSDKAITASQTGRLGAVRTKES
ncbi:protein translocase subunit SecD [Planosporangium flavigriseum]|uniref:Protein translocase subunit SecD n=1 Tax=Planosporangium flavigriseum TaxID=373681 RepID=A0A8J3LQ03_9ACTN|nr:protein translocase subunit SecD [Planosporangium flavigriseum]